jgi:hypothetical protein
VENHVSISGTVHFSIGLANFPVLCARKYVSICPFARRNGREAALPDAGEGMREKKGVTGQKITLNIFFIVIMEY